MRDAQRDEVWLRAAVRDMAQGDAVYVSPAYYDGGYEVRVGAITFFIEYEIIDDNDAAEVVRRYTKKV